MSFLEEEQDKNGRDSELSHDAAWGKVTAVKKALRTAKQWKTVQLFN